MNGTVENLCEAVTPWVVRHSAVIRISTNSGGVDVASATCVQIADRFFLATARHNVAGVPSKKWLAVLPAEGQFASKDHLPVQQFGYPNERNIDVAWIELNPGDAESAGLKGIALSDLGPGVALSSGNLYLAAGVQAATRQLRRKGFGSPVLDLKFRCCMSNPFDTSTSGDFKLNYAGRVVCSDGSIRDQDPPHGMSGGGLWSITREQWSGIWLPDRCRVIGIVTHYDRKGGFLRCAGIEHWISLLRQSDSHLDLVIGEFAESMVKASLQTVQPTRGDG